MRYNGRVVASGFYQPGAPLLMVFRESYRTLPVGIIYFSSRYTTNQSLVAAGVTITTLPIVAVYIAFQRRFIDGITVGALK
ncbi:MAG: hypothetical protein ACLFP4_06915 [Spirochaetales bacterium]